MGVFDVEEIKAGLVTGRFVLSDLGWKEGMEGWKPLSEFAELANVPTHPPLPPLEGVGEAARAMQMEGTGESEAGLPWDRRAEIGLVQAYLQTVKLVLIEPARAFSSMHPEGGLIEPLIFALIGGTIGGLAWLVSMQLLLHNPESLAQINQLPAQYRVFFVSGAGISAVFLTPIRVAVGAFIAAAMIHVCLMLVGGAKRSFETTFRVLCFCMGSTNLLLLLPFCGFVIAGVWGLIVEVIGLAKAHGIETGRALTAVLLPLICCCAFFAALLFAVVALGISRH